MIIVDADNPPIDGEYGFEIPWLGKRIMFIEID